MISNFSIKLQPNFAWNILTSEGRSRRSSRARGGGGIFPPYFLKSCRKFSNFSKILENLIRFLWYASPAFKSGCCLWIKSHFSTQNFLPPRHLATPFCWSGSVNVSSNKSERATVFSITCERKEIKTWDFLHWNIEYLYDGISSDLFKYALDALGAFGWGWLMQQLGYSISSNETSQHL